MLIKKNETHKECVSVCERVRVRVCIKRWQRQLKMTWNEMESSKGEKKRKKIRRNHYMQIFGLRTQSHMLTHTATDTHKHDI